MNNFREGRFDSSSENSNNEMLIVANYYRREAREFSSDLGEANQQQMYVIDTNEGVEMEFYHRKVEISADESFESR